MDPPKINYINNNTLMVINPKGKMRELFVPFNVKVLQDTNHFKEKSWVVVEEIRQHPQYLLLYRVINNWWPYYLFRLDVRFKHKVLCKSGDFFYSSLKSIKMTTIPGVAEISVRYKPSKAHKPMIKSSDDAYYHMLKFFPEDTIALHETFVVGYLNRANRLIGVYELRKGGITGTVADRRLVLSVALKVAATGIILAHNHPSGNMQASDADKEITHKIQKACEYLDIKVLDHLIIVPERKYLSLNEEGLM